MKNKEKKEKNEEEIFFYYDNIQERSKRSLLSIVTIVIKFATTYAQCENIFCQASWLDVLDKELSLQLFKNTNVYWTSVTRITKTEI